MLLTGIPLGVIPTAPAFTNFTGTVQADMLRLNTSIPPAKSPNPGGVVFGDLAGFPNGRRVFDDVVTVELRAVAGAILHLVDPSFTPDAAVGLITDGLTDNSPGGPYLDQFPYLGVPYDGYDHPSARPAVTPNRRLPLPRTVVLEVAPARRAGPAHARGHERRRD